MLTFARYFSVLHAVNVTIGANTLSLRKLLPEQYVNMLAQVQSAF